MIGYEKTSSKGAVIQRQETIWAREQRFTTRKHSSFANECILFLFTIYKAKSYLESRLYLIYCAVYLPHPGNTSTFLYLGQLYIDRGRYSIIFFGLFILFSTAAGLLELLNIILV